MNQTIPVMHARRMTFDSLQYARIKSSRLNFSPSFQLLRADSTYFLAEISDTGFPVFKAPLNAGAALTTGVTQLQNESMGFNLRGENLLVGIWDDGLVKDHIELGNRILTKEGVSSTNHMTHVTGTILATGINTAAKGMAPKATGVTWYFDNDLAEMMALASGDQKGLLFSNHSYGIVTGWTKVNGAWAWTGDSNISNFEDYRHGFYGSDAQLIDELAYAAPYYSIFWAAGNDRIEVGDGTHPPDGNGGTGYDCIIPQSVAKNIITVGAVNKVASYTDASSVVMTNFSSWGPTDDGRIKPDLVAAGVALTSLSGSGTNGYATASGTSMATPNATGSLMLVQELYNKLHGGKFMRASTLKALAIHTAKEAGNFPGPDYSSGWGLLDVQSAANVLLHDDQSNNYILEETLNDGDTFTLDIHSQANQKITVTICWTDPEGTPVAPSLDPTTIMLVNDLDVRLADALGNEQMPWVLNPLSPTLKATTGDNIRDNVEKIEFLNPQAGKYTVKVNHKGTLAHSAQAFSLIVTCKSSSSSGNTLYWIGGTGNWNDPTHWSLSTGGATAGVVPLSNDNVVIDDNSLPSSSSSVMSLSGDVVCKKFCALTDRAAMLSFNGHSLTISNDCSIAAPNFSTSIDGSFKFQATGAHTVNLHHTDLYKSTFDFKGGAWTLLGDFGVGTLIVSNDTLFVNSNHASIKTLSTVSNSFLEIRGMEIDSLTSVQLNGKVLAEAGTVFNTAKTSTISLLTPFDGTIVVPESGLMTINSLDSLDVINVGPGATVTLANGLAPVINVIHLNADSIGAVTLNAVGHASITLGDHLKDCFDYVNVSDVDLKGSATIVLKSHSAINNSTGWDQGACGQALFPDFAITYPCQYGMTFFQDLSSGQITTRNWDFGDGTPALIQTSNLVYHAYQTSGTFMVNLTVSDGINSKTYIKPLKVVSSGLPDNRIALIGTELMSVNIGDQYQWFDNGTLIDGATSRSYSEPIEPGTLSVLVTDGECNILSAPYVVTAIEAVNTVLSIFPNPVHDRFDIASEHPIRSIDVYDALGSRTLTQDGMRCYKVTIDLSATTNGVYLLRVRNIDGTVVQRKLIVAH